MAKNEFVVDGVKTYLKNIRNYPLLSYEDEQKLGKRIAAGDERAKTELINSNLRLVVSVAKKYMNHCRIPFIDLVQEGNMGLIKAVDKYDYTLGHKFSTYATYWIRQSISKAILDQSRTIRIPVHMLAATKKFNAVAADLEYELGREPKLEEIAKAMNITIEKAKEIQNIVKEPVSLNTMMSEDDETELIEFVPSENDKTPFELAAETESQKAVKEVLSTLDEREQQVVALRFGLGGGEAKTLEECGKILGLTKERIRQIEQKALHKLRNPIRAAKLRPLFEENK